MKRLSHRKLRRAQSIQRFATTRRPRPLGVSLARFTSAVAIAGALFASAGRSEAATFYWDADATDSGNNATTGAGLGNLGASPFTWDTSLLNWWPGTGADVAWTNGSDLAVFTGTSGAVNLGTPITAGGLTFNTSGYNLTGAALTLTPPAGSSSPVIAVNGIGTRATIDSLLAGTSGLAKTGDGILILTNNSNSFSGDISIKAGTISITNAAQLGTGTTAISVTGIASAGNPGFTGGSLLLNGVTTASGTGLTLNREVSVAGRGPGAVNNNGGVVSVGYNTLGDLTMATPATEARIWATHGSTIVNGGVDLGSGASQIFQGNGNWIINGVVTGSEVANDRFIKTGQLITTTLWLKNANNNFSQSIRLDSGSVRVGTNGALGLNVTNQAVDLQNASLEVRTDAPAGFATRNVLQRSNTSGNVFVDHGMDGSLGIGAGLLGQTVTFGGFRTPVGSGQTATFAINGRNGYGLSFTGASLATGGGDGNVTINVNTNGLVTFNGDLAAINIGTTARTLTFGGNGDTLITGSFTPGGSGAHVFTKGGTGLTTINGSASTYTGVTNISAGTLAFGNVGAFASSSQIRIGNATTTSGTLTYTGGTNQLTNDILLNTTTANVYLNASGTGTLTLSGGILSSVTGSKTLVLGGTGAAVLQGAISNPSSGTISLQKIGGGTWTLSGANGYTGSTTISGGTLQLQDTFAGSSRNVMADGSAIIFNADTFTQAAGGALQYLGANASASSESVGALTATAGHGTVQALPGAGGSATLTFSSLGARTAGATINVLSTGAVNVTGTSGFLNAGTYFGGADFAFSGGGTTLRAPIYGTDAGFVTSASALTAGSHNEITGSFSTDTISINSLRSNGANTLTLNGSQTLTIGTAAGSGIIQTGGSGTITGGTALATSAAGNDLTVRVDGSGNTLTIETPITTSTAGLTKSGGGTLILSGANSYSGNVNVNEGTLKLAGSGLLGATNIGLNVRQGATFDLNGVNVGTVASGNNSVNALNGAGTITNSGALATLVAGNSNSSGYFTGLLTGNLSLVKNGTGTLSLTGANSFTGPVVLSGGTLAVTSLANIGSSSALGAGDNTNAASNAASLVFNGGTLQYTGANTTIFQATQTPSVSIDRLFTIGLPGSVAAVTGTIDSSPSYGNGVLARNNNSAALVFSNTGDIVFQGTGTRTLTLTGDSIGDNQLRTHLVDNGASAFALTKAGGSLWILNPATSNTYTGETTVSGGALRVAPEGAAVQGLPTTSLLTLNGGVLETSGTFTRTLGATQGTNQVRLTGGASGFSAATADRLVVTIGGGPLTWGDTNFNPSSLVLNSSTALGEVEVTNDINLGSSARTITVNNNSNTGTMMTAGIVSGVLSGSAALTKSGSGVLMLGNANTYTGNTTVAGGNLIVTSVGGAATSSSLGGVGGTLIYNPGDSDLNALNYVGGGETASRAITFTSSAQHSTNRTYRIDSSGSGALVLNGTFTNTVTENGSGRTITLELRGSNTDLNQLNMVLKNSTGTNTPVLGVSKNDGGVWILSPATPNLFTGNITASGGTLGLTSNGIGSAGAVVFNNGGIFAFGGPLTISRPVQIAANTTGIVSGSNAITLSNTLTGLSSNSWNLSNNLEGGALLTINGNFINAESGTTARTLNLRGYGSTVINGSILNSATSLTRLDIRMADTATVTLGGDNTVANGLTNGILLGQGTLNIANPLALGGTSNALILDGGVLTSSVDLTGASKIINKVQLQGDQVRILGSNNIELGGTVALEQTGSRLLRNDLDAGKTLTISGQVSLTTETTARTLTIRGTGVTVITGAVVNGGTGASGLAYSGLGTLNLTGTNTATGALTVNRGTVVLSGTTGGSWNNGSFALNPTGTLRIDNSGGENPAGRINNAGAFAGNGGILDLIGDGDGTAFTGGALTLNSVQTFINMSGAGPNTLNFASVNFANSGSSLNLGGVPNLGTTNKVTFTAALAANAQINGVMPRTFIGGNDFATYDTTNGVKAFTNYNPTSATNINLAGATDTVAANAGMTNTTLSASKTINALKIDGSGIDVTGAGRTLTLNAAAILNTGGNNSLSPAAVNFGGNVGYIQVNDLTTLTVNSALVGTGGWAKALPGTLVLNTPTFISSTTNLLRGTTKLNGGLNTLFPNQTLNINDGATLDLNGTTQYIGALSDPGTLPGAGGAITSLSGTGTLVTNMSSSQTAATEIQGAVNLARVGGNTLTFDSALTYTGTTTLMGGTLALQNDASILNTSSIEISGANLTLNNSSSLQTANYNRIADTTPITLRTGTITFSGKVSDPSFENFGALAAAEGANTITVNTGGTGTAGAFTSADVSFTGLARTAGATVNFTGSNLGQAGNNSRIVFTTPPPAVTTGALGAWAIANSTDYAAYNTGNGVGIVGTGGYTGYDGTFGSGNITEIPATAATTLTLPSGTTTTGLLKVSGGFNNDIAFTNASDVLNLELGGLLRSSNNNATSIGTTATRGVLTAGGTESSGTRELIVYSNATGTANFTGGATTAGSNIITMTNTAGLSPGMTVTNSNLPTGTYIVSVNDGTTVTVSQNATAAATSQTFVGGASNVIVNSVIANNGAGNSVMLVKSGAGILNLSANNTYTGGTIVNQGTLNLIGSGAVIPAGGLTITNGVVTMLTNSGQIHSSNTVTLNGSSTLTLAGGLGSNNTLNSLTFNNNGGTGTPTVTIPTNSILTLSSAAPITVSTANAAVTPTISGGFLALTNGVNTLNIGDINVAGQTYTKINPALSISSVITGSGSINKTGGGVLQLSGQSTFSGGVNVAGGGILISGNSTPTVGGDGVMSGPLGTGALTVGSGATLLVDGSRTIGNDVTFAGTPTFDATANTVWSLTLNGAINGLPNGAVNVNVINPNLTVNLLGPISNIGSITSINSSGLGRVFFNSTGFTGDFVVSGASTLSIFNDGDGTGQAQTISLGSATFDAGVVPNITIGRAGGTLPFNQAANKTLKFTNLTPLVDGLTVTNNNSYKLLVTDAIALNSGATFSVANATASNLNAGLELSGVLGGAGFTKTGNGALVVSNTGNTFSGSITVNQGTLAVADSAALGNGANKVLLSPTGSNTATFRATDDITTSRVIGFGTTTGTRAIEVVGGKTLQLDSAFDVTGNTSAGLAKNDNGVLILNADNSAAWTGQLTINGGAVRVAAAGALGGTTAQVLIPSVFGAALQLAGGVTVANPINLNNGSGNAPQGGINFGGQLENVSGTNIYSGAITTSADAGIGADSGSTLNITGGISMATTTARAVFFNAVGDINISGTSLTGGAATAWHRIEKMGPGTLTISNANTIAITGDTVKVRQGALVFNGAGTLTGVTNGFLVEGGATLALDNGTTNAISRLGGKPVIMEGGTFNYTANGSANSAETAGVLTLNSGGSTINLSNSGAANSILTFASVTQNAGGTLDVEGTFGSASNALKFTTAPTLTPAATGLLPRMTVNGNEFATYNATNGIVAFTGYAAATNILSAGATQTFKATSSTANSLTSNQTLNALDLNGGGMNVGAVSGLVPTTLTLTSGAVLVNGGGGVSTLAVPVIALGAEGIFHVQSGQELQVSSGITGSSGLTKSLGGTLTFTGQQFYTGTTTVNAGTLNLPSNITNPLLFNNSLTVNVGGTVDLNGGVQYVGNLASQGATPGAGVGGGTVQSTGGTGTLITNSNSSFGGQIIGAINLVKSNSTLNLTNVNSYTGTTTITGGNLNLADNGALTNTTAIDINYGTLTLTNGNLYNSDDRVNDTAPITMRGGVMSFTGRAQFASSETLGNLSLVQGSNNLNSAAGGTGVNSADLTFNSLTHSNGATLNINGANGQAGSAGRILINSLNGSSPAQNGLVNNIVGGWAINGGADFITYVPTLGIATLGATGAANYDATAFPVSSSPTFNVKLSSNSFVVPGVANYGLNSLVFATNATGQSITFTNDTDTLNLTSGGIIKNGAQSGNIGGAIDNGRLTAGGSVSTGGPVDLYFHQTQAATTTVNSRIVDNAVSGDAVRLVYTPYITAVLSLANPNNSYSGGTIVNGWPSGPGTLNVAATGLLPAGGLTINNGTVSQTAGGVIAPQAVTINGPGTLTFANQANTLTNVTFNNNGGGNSNLNPTGTLKITGNITSNPSNVGGIATIGAGTIDMNANNSFAINVAPYNVAGATDVAPWQAGLNINAVLDNGAVAKGGAGNLQLSGQSTFTGGVTINAGGLILGADSTPNIGPATILSGPVGLGTLTMGANTSLLAGGASRTILNNVTFLGDTTFNGTFNLTLNGVTTLPSVWNAAVTAPQMTVTIADATPSQASDTINKSGLGTLNVGNYAGTIAAAGALVFTGDGNGLGSVESLPLGGALTINGDTALTINHSGAAANARNKILQKSSLSITGNILAVSNLSGYGLEITGNTTMTGPAHFSVGAATASNVVQGLTLTGVVSGAFDLTKSGSGTLVLGSSGNTFGGAGHTIDILNGIVSIASDGALGDINNTVTLDVDAATGVGLRVTKANDTVITNRTVILNQPNNAIEVVQGQGFGLTAPLSVPVATSTLFKNDNGMLAFLAANPNTWTGGVTVNAGSVFVLNSGAFGATTAPVTVANISGAAVQLGGDVNVANPFTITTAGVNTGINTGGVIESVSGNNTWSGLITQPSGTAVTLGADGGAILNITGGISSPANNSITFAGAGDINLTTVGMNTGSSVTKLGSGTLTISVANPNTTAAQTLNVTAGAVVFNGGGTLGPAASSGAVTVDVGGTLTLDNRTAALGGAGSAVSNRLGSGRDIVLRGASLNLIGNETTDGTETFAVPNLQRGLTTITVTAQTGAEANLVFANSATVPANAQNNSTAPTGVSLLFRGTSLGSAQGDGVATIKDIGTTSGFAFNGQNGATGTKNKGLMPYALIDTTETGSGISFATGNSGGTTNAGTIAILRPLAANEYETANTVTANNNILLNAGATTNVAAGVTPNSVTFEADAKLTLGNGVLFNLSSGGVLVRSGSTSTISGGALNQTAGFSPLNLWTVGDLTINSVFNGGNGVANSAVGFVKAGAGTLTLTTPTSTLPGLAGMGANTMSGQLVINQGTLVLDGGKNTILANNFLALDGGTLDLHGNSQQVLSLFTDGAVAGAGGIITSSVGTGNFVINQDNAARNWAGSIQDNVNLTRSGQNTLKIYSPQPYFGPTLINGGTTLLQDRGSLAGTSAIDLNFATLTVDNNAGTTDMQEGRLNDTATITMRGGSLTLNGRAQTQSVETIGAIVLDGGSNFITPNAGGTGINSMDVIAAGLSRTNTAATLQVGGTNLGTIGSSPRITLGSLNGVATDPVVFGAGLTNNIVGGWAEAGNEFLTYIPGLGLAALNQVGAPGYDFATLVAGSNPTKNARITATATVPSGGIDLNTLTMSGSITLNFANATDTLNLTSGGLIGPNNNQNIGATLDSGRLTAGGLTPGASSDLYIFNRANTLVINSRIVNNTNGGGSAVRAVLTATNGAITFVNPNASYTGGTVLNGGTLNLNGTSGTTIPLAANPANGLVINGATVTMNNSAGQIAAGNTVTLNGSSTLNLWGNNTIASLVYNNLGGTGNLVVQSFSTAASAGNAANGVLTIGGGGLTVTSSNVATSSYIVGRADFGTSPNTINVDTINANGTNDIAPLQAAFVFQGLVGSSGGITKTGAGVLQFSTQGTFTGPFTVAAGGLKNAVTNGGSRYSALTLNDGTRYDLNNSSPQWGSLAGSGTVFSAFGTPTLTVGFDNTSTTFSGQFSRFNDATPNDVQVLKVGSGTWRLDAAQSATTGSTGNFTISGGTLAYAGAGSPFPSVPTATAPTSALTFTVNSNSTLKLDNAAANLNNRLAMSSGAGQVTVQGGTFLITGNSGTDTAELINNITFQNGGGFISFAPDAASKLDLTITTLNSPNGSGTALIRGIDGTVSTSGKASLTITNATLIGSQGGGANGTTNRSIRADALADASLTGLGTGFLVKDSATSLWRPLGGFGSGELNVAPTTWVTAQNAGIDGSAQLILANTTANSLTAGGTSSLGSGLNATTFGDYGQGGGLLTQSFNTSTILALDGSSVAINVGSVNGTAGNTLTIHTVGTAVLDMNSYYGIGNTAGLIKADDGTLNLNKAAFYTGGSGTVVNGGRLNLNSGADNTIAVVPGATTPTVLALQVNGTNAVVDLKNFNQTVAGLTTNSTTQGGTVTNSGANMATLTSTGGGTFAGQLTGANLAFTRAGNNTTLLTSANTYGGPTIIRGGTLQLRDAGSILNTSAITVNYGTLLLDNFGLNPVVNPTRIAQATPVTLQGGVLTLNGAGSTDNSVAIDSLTIAGGGNTVNILPQISMGSTAEITIGNLVRNASNHSMVNFNGFTTNNSSGTSTLGGQGLNANGNIILSKINGSAFTAANLTNKLIGGWAVADGNTFATYVDGYGISVMGQTTQGIAAPAFDGSDVSAATTATQNISDGTAARTITGAHTANSWRFSQSSATQTITLAASTPVTLGVGLITNSNQTTTIQGTDATSTIAGTGTDLYVYVNQSVTTNINAKITGSAALVRHGGGTLALNPAGGSNDYTGGTYALGGTLNLNGGVGIVTIPGDLTIANSTVTMNSNPGQIATSSNVTINGGGSLTFANYATGPTQTIASVTFNNEGGAGTPNISLGTPTSATSTLVISGANAITSVNNSFATTPTFSTGASTLTALQFSNAAPVIATSGLSVNGLNIAVPITSAGGPLTKMGPGSLTLSAASTFTTGFNLNEGSLIFGAGTTGTVTNGPIGTGALTIAGGTSILSDGTARTIANATTVNGNFAFGGVTSGNNLTLSGAVNLGAATRTITVSSPAVTGTISGAITSTAAGTALIKAGPGTLTLQGSASDLAGAAIAVSEGILKNGATNALPNLSPLAISAGAGFDLNGFDLALQQINGTGFITNSANNTKTLTLGGTGATDTATTATFTFAGALTDNRGAAGFGSSALALTKAGAGTLTLTGGLDNYFGATTLVAGTLLGGATNAFSPNSAVIIGNSATATGAATATLDTGAFDQTIGGLSSTLNTAAGSALINIASGQTLTANGPVFFGSNTSATDVTNVSFTGGGNLIVNGTSFQVGGATGSTNTNGATVNMAALASLTANLGATGIFRVGDVNSATNSQASIVTLPTTSTITANIVGVGDTTGGGGTTQTLKLGSGVTTLNANTINVGSGPTGSGARGVGALVFNGASGSLKVRSQADPANGRANLNIANTTFSTGGTTGGTFDTTGHSADLMFNTMVLAARNANTGGATATFNFDAGTLDANDLIAANKANGSTATSAAIAATLNLGGGTVNFNSVTNPVQLGINASGSGTATATMNVTGGTVNIAANNGTALVLGNTNTAGGAANGALSLTGGTTTVAGDIVHGAATGSSTATLNLNGGTLDMGGAKIGGSTAAQNLTSLTFASGTLQNVAEINNGAAFTKTTAGTLILEGTNTYSGDTTIAAGVLQVGTGGTTGTLGTSTAAITDNGALSINRSDAVSIANVISGSGAFNQIGAGTTTFNGASANTYSGLTTVSAGTLALNKTPGVNAIIGDGVGDKDTPDLLINGGNVILQGDHQLDDTVSVELSSGSFNVNGKTETFYWFTNMGGHYISPRGSMVTVTDPVWASGANDIFGNGSYVSHEISGGTNIIHGDEGTGQGAASLTIGSGGLEFSGDNSPNLTVSADHTTAGALILNGNVSFTGTTGTATLTSGPARLSDGVTLDPNQSGLIAGKTKLGASDRTFTVTNAGASMHVSTVIESTGGGLIKDGAGKLTLSAINTYTGPTKLSAGTLAISGSINATASVQVDAGTLLLAGVTGEQINDAATVTLNGGTLAFDSSLTHATETLGSLTLNANSTLDFGSFSLQPTDIGNTFHFTGFTPNGFTLNVYNWSGTAYSVPTEPDHGNPQDRLVFNGISGADAAQINFYSDAGTTLLGNGAQISFDSSFEVVPVPEPSSSALIGAAGLLALIGYRERRRLAGKSRRERKPQAPV